MSYTPPVQRSWTYPTDGSNAATGFTAQIPDGATKVKVVAAGLLLTGTLILPQNPIDGQPITINFKLGITTLTLQAPSGYSINQPSQLSIAGSGCMRIKYGALDKTWDPN